MSNSPPDKEENDKLVKEYKEAIEELKQALIIEANSRNQYNKMFTIDFAYEEHINKIPAQEAYKRVNEQYQREGRYHHMKMGDLPSVYDAGEIATKLQIHAIKLNKELKEKLDKVRYNNVTKDAERDLQSRFKDIKPIVLNSAGETMKMDLKPRLPALEPPDRHKDANKDAVLRGMAASSPKGGSVKSKKRHRRRARHTRHKKRKTNRKKKSRKSRR